MKKKERKEYIRPREWVYVECKVPRCKRPLSIELGCCRCGILHDVEFKKTKDGVAFRMWKARARKNPR